MTKAKSITVPSPDAIDYQLETLALEEDLFEFLKWVFKEIYKRPFIVNWHHRELCKILMAIHRGDLHHTIINMPPRYTKTEIIAKIFPAWCYAKYSRCVFLHLSYSDALALDNSSAVRAIVESVEFQSRWPIAFRTDTTAKKKWKTDTDGEFSAAAAGGSVTGFGAGILGAKKFAGALIIDDPVKPDDAKSDTMRDNVNSRFPETIKSRLNDRKTPMILIMQRLHEVDATGFLLDGGTELEFTHICLPALNEDGPSKYDPRQKGEALWPFKHTEEELEKMRVSNAMVQAGQYQQRPAPKEGNIFKKFNYYKTLPTDELFYKVHSWDMTFKAKSKNKAKDVDFVVGTEWGRGKKTNRFYLFTDMIRARMGYSDTENAVDIFTVGHSDYRAILVEDKANGPAILDKFKKKFRRMIAIEPSGDKVERAEAVAPLFDANDVWLPHKSICPWIEDFVNELKVFPNGKHDDQVDSTTQALEYLDKLSTGSMKDANARDIKPYSHTFNEKANRRRDGKGRKQRIKIKGD